MRLIKSDNSPGVHLLLEKHSQTYIKQRTCCISIHERTAKVNNNELSGRGNPVIFPVMMPHRHREKWRRADLFKLERVMADSLWQFQKGQVVVKRRIRSNIIFLTIESEVWWYR
ncbi:hypothetical protein HO173_003321 [Letharia columbiana]|uniref:Uncharacterized protein n=1 Tax=Letharia columbiana TaxID=112416 RepID=A0A8H6L7S6_9LECA|nr:uncharacterized protein HO173_003321 [Letharia columbiana]KAF6238814.1 hypothetical protein HO173_003321 [Letharia columbiana]